VDLGERFLGEAGVVWNKMLWVLYASDADIFIIEIINKQLLMLLYE
jgi:hypothetical protein